MFGVVPKVLWERECAPDERNRIHLALNVLLVEDGRQRVLIDTGAGTHWDAKARAIYRLESLSPREFLAPARVTPEDIDVVVNTHLHFDHAGGNTERRDDGSFVPSFPNARYVVQKGEVETARLGSERTRASYRSEHFEPLLRERRFQLAEGELLIGPGLRLQPAPGHTPHMQIPVIATGERVLAFLGDLVPMKAHVPYPYIMGFDLEPMVTLATKKAILPLAARERWLLVFEHEPGSSLGVLEEEDGRLRFRAVDAEA
jgi:glyoxylase-like metal-dependent hydrolase (beta-lactamase superfamily II)